MSIGLRIKNSRQDKGMTLEDWFTYNGGIWWGLEWKKWKICGK